jgi:hypothetical protein
MSRCSRGQLVKVDALILADAVSSPPDGKFYVHGGGLTRYEVAGLPAPLPLGVLARIKIGKEDHEQTHLIRFTLVGPTGAANVDPIEARITNAGEEPDRLEGEEEVLQLALQIPGVAVREGLYHLELQINGRVARRVPLPVVVNNDLKLEVREEETTPPPRPHAKNTRSRKPQKKRPAAKKPPKRR